MKKVLSILVALLFAFSVTSYAVAPASDSVVIFGNGGVNGLSPTTKIVPVRYGYRAPTSANEIEGGLSSGDVVIWDVTSADGYTISGCVTDNNQLYAGVLVTDIETADSSTFRRGSRNWGWMAVEGYVLAKVITASATAGEPLVTINATGGVDRAFGTAPTAVVTATEGVSNDIGVLLNDGGTNGLMPVILR